MALQVPVDRGYLNLLAHLRESKQKIPIKTLQAAICYYLVHLPPTQPTPTPLTASIIASPVWYPLSLKNCVALGNTFRISIRENLTELMKKQRGLFDASVSSDLTSWIRGILDGLKDGDSLLRMAISGGLHLGLSNLQGIKTGEQLLRDVEKFLVLAFAETAEETCVSGKDPWAAEFKKSDSNPKDKLDLSILLASQYLNSISTEALSALHLTNLALSCLAVIEKGFTSGDYLRNARDSLHRDSKGSITSYLDSNLERTVDGLLASNSFTSMAYICRLVARVISIRSDGSFRTSRRRELWNLLSKISQNVLDMSRRVEEDWRSSPLADVQSDTQLDEKTRKLTEKIWTVLKTQLFSSLILQQAMLDTILFVPPPPPIKASTYSASRLTWAILTSLSSLSFVIASFGGVAAGPSEAGQGPAFPELKKVFYLSIDILASDIRASELFVRVLVRDSDCYSGVVSSSSTRSPLVNAKRSFVLQCIEQFISVLDDTCIEEVVVPFCEPHLSDPSDRQTYESSHSVMLSIFAEYAEKSGNVNTSLPPSKSNADDRKGKGPERTNDVSLATRLVPGYAQTLLENAREGGLTTAQLRLAYAALIRSASTGRSPRRYPQMSANSSALDKFSPLRMIRSNSSVNEQFTGDPALAWLCVERLLQALSNTDTNSETHFAVCLTLISSISNVGLQLLPRLFEEVERVVDGESNAVRKRVLIENVFEEILERVSDAEREVAMQWWFECSKKWEGCFESRNLEAGSSG